MVIADGDREPAVISADQVDVAPLATLDCQRFTLARVRRLVLGGCKWNTIALNMYTNAA